MDEKTEKIKRILSQKYQDVDSCIFPSDFNRIKDDLGNPSEKLIDFLRKICFFVDYIYQTEELKGRYLKLLEEYNNSKNGKKVKELENEIAVLIKEIANKFNKKEIKTILEKLPEHAKMQSTRHELNDVHCSEFANKIVEIKDNFNVEFIKGIIEFFEEIKKVVGKSDSNLIIDFDELKADLWRAVCKLEYTTDYQPSFKSLKSFYLIDEIYQYIYPHGENYHIKKYKIWSIGYSSELESLKISAKKVYQELINWLDDRVCRHTVIERVKNYLELFGDRDIDSETSWQKEAEKIIFLERYYPISQAELKRARIDTLLVSDKDVILVEYKDTKAESSKLMIEKDLRSAFIQSETYRSQLSGFPKLRKEVYIIIFCSGKMIKIEAKRQLDGIPYLDFNGYIYYFVPIKLLDKNASELKDSDYVSVNIDNLSFNETESSAGDSKTI